MIVMGVVQTLLALVDDLADVSASSSASLVNLAVVTNVVPYIIALSALIVMMKKAGGSRGLFRRNTIVAVLLRRSTARYAIYASGLEPVTGRHDRHRDHLHHLRLPGAALLDPRPLPPRPAGGRSDEHARPDNPGAHMQRAVSLDRGTRRFGVALFVSALLTSSRGLRAGARAASSTLERIQSSGKLTMWLLQRCRADVLPGGRARRRAMPSRCASEVRRGPQGVIEAAEPHDGGRSGRRQESASAPCARADRPVVRSFGADDCRARRK